MYMEKKKLYKYLYILPVSNVYSKQAMQILRYFLRIKKTGKSFGK